MLWECYGGLIQPSSCHLMLGSFGQSFSGLNLQNSPFCHRSSPETKYDCCCRVSQVSNKLSKVSESFCYPWIFFLDKIKTIESPSNERVSSKRTVDAVHQEPKAVRVKCNLTIRRFAQLESLKDFIFNFRERKRWLSWLGMSLVKGSTEHWPLLIHTQLMNSNMFCLVCGK